MVKRHQHTHARMQAVPLNVERLTCGGGGTGPKQGEGNTGKQGSHGHPDLMENHVFVCVLYCNSAVLTLASTGDIISKLRSASASLTNVLAVSARSWDGSKGIAPESWRCVTGHCVQRAAAKTSGIARTKPFDLCRELRCCRAVNARRAGAAGERFYVFA